MLEIHFWDPVTGETRSSHKAKTSFAAYKLTFSPDGRTLLGAASVRDFDGGFADGPLAVDSPARIELIDVMTARPRHHIAGFAAPAFSPDGKRIAYVVERPGDGLELYAMDTNGANWQRLTDSRGSNESPSWSPDSRHIIFVSTRSGASRLYTITLETGVVRAVPQLSHLRCEGPSWGPRRN